ncbi:chorismate mutase [Pseudomonas citronellolis]|uniref:chorismate mutase n=1 Tax=Pseudomonas citronellolis TaxID=53408 RepID=UPI0022BA319D|nr:chorismate mutase [Pseudomonas citronellolis]
MSSQLTEAGASVAQTLAPYRRQLDIINQQVVDLLAQRMDICRTIAEVKFNHHIPMMQPQRVTSTLDMVRALATARQLRPGYLVKLFTVIINETCDEEQRLMDALSLSGRGR